MAGFASEVSGTQMVEFFSRFGRFGGSMAKLQKLLGDDEYMKDWIERLEEPSKSKESDRIHDLFTNPQAQIARVREINLKRGWGFNEADFLEAEKSIPRRPDGKLVVVTLVPYLGDEKNGRTGVERTFHELWEAAVWSEAAARWRRVNEAYPVKLRLLEGVEHVPGLRWEVMDLGCHFGRRPVDIRAPKESPHAGILATVMLHPKWAEAMNGGTIPYVWIPGYQINPEGEGSWEDTPYISFFTRGDREVELRYRPCHHDSCSSVPVFVDSQRIL